MHILWCTCDTTYRASNFLSDFRIAVSKYTKVTTLVHDMNPAPLGMYQKQLIKENKTIDNKLLNIINNTDTPIDFIMAEAPTLVAYKDDKWDKITIPKGFLAGDMHNSHINKWRFKHVYKFGFSFFFYTYRDGAKKYRKKELNDFNSFWIPLAVDINKFHDYNNKGEISVLSTGRLNESVYPIRTKLAEKLKSINKFKRVKRPNDRLKSKWPINEDYAKLLSSAYITIVCGGDTCYPLEKYYEVPACKSLLYAPIFPELESLGFKPGENMIKVDLPNTYKQVTNLLSNLNKIDRISENGYQLIQERHTLDIRAKQFIKILEDNL